MEDFKITMPGLIGSVSFVDMQDHHGIAAKDAKGTQVVEVRELVQNHGLEVNEENHIRWQKQNPKHPRNWSGKRKAFNTVVILLLEFITYVRVALLVDRWLTRL